jgi:hypothetical protein
MKHLKRFNESIIYDEEELYKKWKEFIESLIETFLDFEDNDWYWSTGSKSGIYKSISLDWWPEFKCVMLKGEYDYVPVKDIDYLVDYTGYFRKGDIFWESEEFVEKVENKNKEAFEEVQDFIVNIKRLNDTTGVDFKFSYNNKGGDLKIVIMGFVKVKI